MTSSTLPDISRDKLDGFRKMAVAVIDDMHEAARDLANRHEHQVDLMKARIDEQDQQLAAIANEVVVWNRMLGEAIGEQHGTLGSCIESAVELIATLRHRIDEVQKQLDAIAAEAAPQFLGLTVGDLAEVLKEEATGESNHAVFNCLVIEEDGDVCVVDSIREMCCQLRFLDDTVMNLAPTPATKKRGAGAAALAEVPPQKGPFVVTMKLPQGRRFWGPVIENVRGGWVSDLARAYQYADAATAEAAKPRRSAVVTLADARELIVAEKVVSITPPADAPTGPEAA